jgi:hypothetical protein
VGGAHVVRHAPDRPLHQAVRGPDHLPRHPDHRRDRQRRDGAAALPAGDGLRPGHQHLHQLARWLLHRADCHLRHDPLHQAGQAASAAAVLLAAGTPGKRLALPNSRIIIHQPATEGTYGQSSDIEIQANEILRLRSLLEKMLAEASGKSHEEVSRDIERDKFLTADQAIEYGLIDDILQTLKTPVPAGV